MLMIVLQMAKYDKLAATFSSIPVGHLLLVVFGYSVGPLLNSYRWRTVAAAGGVQASYPAAVRAYFIGMYLNCFGLGTVGGDVARGLLIAPGQHRKAEALASVVADRLHGLAVLSGIGAVATLIFGVQNLDQSLAIALIGIGAGIAIGWFVGPPLVVRFVPKSLDRFKRKIEDVMRVFPRNPVVFLRITAVSIVFHLMQISLHRVMGDAVGVEIPWSFLLVAVPFVNILGTLPISWNGLGVREQAYTFFFVPAFLTTEQAVAFGAMWLLAVTASSAIGGIVAVMTKDFSKIEEAAAAEAANGQPQVSSGS